MHHEEPSVSEILSSIRQVLSKEANALSGISDDISDLNTQNEKNDFENKSDGLVIELTPQMRLNGDALLSPKATKKTKSSLEKLHGLKEDNTIKPQVENELKPYLIQWLNAHLPDIVERVVTQEVRRIINGK